MNILSGLSPFLGENDQETQTNICQVYVPYDIEQFKNVSQPALDFLKLLLLKDIKKRLTCSQSLNQKWFRNNKHIRKRSESCIGTKGLQKFISQNTWRVHNNFINFKKIYRGVSVINKLAGSRCNHAEIEQQSSIVWGTTQLTRTNSF
ncbi:hypothetical protein HZS_2015 [Henneguya salminicola]|nr:hypothetical protein HZS_2015 [Henneguya salminicola]